MSGDTPNQLVGFDSPESFKAMMDMLTTLQDQMAGVIGNPGNLRVVPQNGTGPPVTAFRVTSNLAGDYYPAMMTYRVPDATGAEKWADLTEVRIAVLNDEKLEIGRRYDGVFTGGLIEDKYPVVQCGGNNSAITIDVPISFDVNVGPPCTLTVKEYRRYSIRAAFIEVVSTTIVAGP